MEGKDSSIKKATSSYGSKTYEKQGWKGGQKNNKKKRGLWTNKAVKLAINAVDSGYKMSQVCKQFQISRSSLRNHYEARKKNRKLGPLGGLTTVEEKELVHYLEKMVRASYPLNITHFKAKVVELT